MKQPILQYAFPFGFALSVALTARPASALDLTQGTMVAVPVKIAQAPKIDGDLSDWDLSGSEPVWLAPETASMFNGDVALMYDADALYIGARLALPNRPLNNPNSPADAFWGGDALEFRLASDTTLPVPLEPQDPVALDSNRIAHLTIWKNTVTGSDYLNIAYGIRFDKGGAVNPAGSNVVVKQGINHYIAEARVPWAALNVPDGKNPFGGDRKMTAVWGLQWGGDNRTAALYRKNPGAFAFQQSGTWGQVEFAPKGNIAPRHITMAQALAADAPKPVGVPIEIQVPKPLKVSVNIFGPNGEVVRELMGGQSQPAGKLMVHWDGRDQWGAPVSPGNYRWGAYFSEGLQAQYFGAVGMSGEPAYDTADGTGGWGGDHGANIDVSADASGLYFLWEGAEDGRVIVKTDYNGKVIWRKSPFVGGGFGPFFASASNGKQVFMAFGGAKPHDGKAPTENNKPWLVRMDAANGQFLPYDTPIKMAAISESFPSGESAPSDLGEQPETVGLAASANEVFASVYSKNIIQILDPESGKPIRTLSCPGPRGLALAPNGDLFAVSYAAGKTPQVVVFRSGNGEALPVIKTGLLSPWDVAVDAKGNLHVTDGGKSQQIKVFSPDGKLVRSLGKAGGRPWAGNYNPVDFLRPTGIAADNRGGILLAEASPPKVMSRWDATSGKNLGRWFGSTAYSTMVWPDPADPLTAYYTLSAPEGFARAKIPPKGGNGVPEAYWALPEAGFPETGTLVKNIAAPKIMVANNGLKYFVSDAERHGIALIKGDQVLPVAEIRVRNSWYPDNPEKITAIDVWSDTNGDHKPQQGEIKRIDKLDGKPLPALSDVVGSMHMQPNSDVYLVTQANKILKLPASGFIANGTPNWATDKLSVAVPRVLEKAGDSLSTGFREGILGLRLDSAGNIYTVVNARVDYATPELTERMAEGMGHSGHRNAFKFLKFSPDGKPLWIAGRKATAAAKPGEMYHFWVLAGLVGDEYVAGQSEWGQFYFYTKDGFFVDSLMNNPGLAPPSDAYTFGGETFGGRVQYFPKTGEVWAYQASQVYKVNGFANGKVVGESRISGTVNLDRVYDAAAGQAKVGALQIVPVQNVELVESWKAVPISTIRRNDSELATSQLGYDADFVYARIHVKDATPLQNIADSLNLIFKGGDAVGISFGKAGEREKPEVGDVRLLAAMIGGQPKLVALKPFTSKEKKPETYFTPATGEHKFEYVGEVAGGGVTLTADADGQGYIAQLKIPRSVIELDFKTGATLKGEVEVLLSGQGARGLQATSRNYLFSPQNSQTTMTDDIPTESWLYPKGWGAVEIK